MNTLLNRLIVSLALLVASLSSLIIITGSSPALAATAGTLCSKSGDTQGSLVCGNCSSGGCVWQNAATSTDTNAKEGAACHSPGVTEGSLTCASCNSDGTGCVWQAKGDSDTVCRNTTNKSGTVNQSQVQTCLAKSPIIERLQSIVDFLSAGVGIIVTGVILLGGIQYIIAGGNPQQLTAARQRIMNGLIALFAFLFIFAFLQWLIPGGIFK